VNRALFTIRQVAGLLVLAAAMPLGCGAARHSNVRSNLDAMEQERTSDKLVERGRAFAAVGDRTRAEQYLSMALDAGADPAQILPRLLRVCIEEDRYLVALEYAHAYLQKNPDDVHLRFVVASLEAAVGEEKKALSDLRTLTTVRPDQADAHFALASLVRETRGDPEEADRHFREYLRLSPGGQHASEARASLLQEVP
jgi:tetratricopeptide (TPR) repeat protein